MRDRLIELLKRIDYVFDDNPKLVGNASEYVADYILANGVIVPPCKVGDDIYLIPRYNGKPMGFVEHDKVQMIGITSRGIHIKARENHDHNRMYMLGKTVFLTREEAERALKGGEGR